MRGGRGGSRAFRSTLVVAIVLLGGGPAAGVTLLDSGTLGRWSVAGYAEAYGVWAVDHDSPIQGPEGIIDTQLTGEVHQKARVFLDVRGLAGGHAKNPTGLGFANIGDTFQNISPEVDLTESYLDLFLPSVDVRIGKQKFAWGKLDTFQPTDVLDPRRYTDPFITEEQDAKIGIPALRASYYPPSFGPRFPTDTSVTLVWVPIPIPVRFPLADERWFPSALLFPDNFPIYRGTLGHLPDGTPIPRINVQQTLRTVNVRPPQQLDEGSVGLRLAGVYADADWSLYYYNGAETAPA